VDAHRIEVFDHIGRLVTTQVNQTNQIDLDGLVVGIYLLKIYAGKETYSAKVMKE
jgi:hypothetical protein